VHLTEYICSKCHYAGKPRYKKRGSAKTEFMMWATFPLGIPYTVWRMFGKTKLCKECSGEILIDLDTPLGARLLQASEDEIMGKIAGTKPLKPAQAAQFIATIDPEISPPVDIASTEEEKPSPPPTNPKPRAHQDPNQW